MPKVPEDAKFCNLTEILALATKVKRAQRGVTDKGLLKWPGPSKGKPRKKGDYIPECTYLGETLICLSSTYENHVRDCEWVETTCNEAPRMADALTRAAAEIEALRKERESTRKAVAKMIERVEAGEIEYGDMVAECDELRVQVLDN